MSDDETREEIKTTVNDEPQVQEPVQEAVVETILEEAKPVKAKPKAKAKAKPKIKITKEPVEPIKEVVKEEPEPVIEVEVGEKPKQIYKNKQMANCPDCNLSMTQHTLNYIRKQGGCCKGSFQQGIK